MILFILLYKVVLTFESVEKSYGVTIQMKATEQYFPVILFILLYKVVLTFESVEKSYGVTIQMKASEKYFPVRASDISRKKRQNFAGFSGANSRKNRPISRDFRGKKVKIRGAIGRFQAIFAREKSKFAEKSAHFAGF